MISVYREKTGVKPRECAPTEEGEERLGRAEIRDDFERGWQSTSPIAFFPRLLPRNVVDSTVLQLYRDRSYSNLKVFSASSSLLFSLSLFFHFSLIFFFFSFSFSMSLTRRLDENVKNCPVVKRCGPVSIMRFYGEDSRTTMEEAFVRWLYYDCRTDVKKKKKKIPFYRMEDKRERKKPFLFFFITIEREGKTRIKLITSLERSNKL